MIRDFKGIWIPKEIWLNNELNIIQKLLLIEINSLDNEDGCFASNSYFAEFFGITETQISKNVSLLKDKGYIEQISFDGRKRILKSNINVDIGKSAFNKTSSLPLTKLQGCFEENFKHNNIVNNTENNTKDLCENFSSITSKEIKTSVDSLKHGTKTIRDLISILVEKKIMSSENFSKLNLKEIEEYFIEHALIHLSGFKKKLPATMPDELMTDDEYLKTFGYGRTTIESRMVLYYGEDWKEELKRRRKEFDEQTKSTGYDGVDLLFAKIETMIDWCIRNNREIKNLKTTFLTFIKPKKFK